MKKEEKIKKEFTEIREKMTDKQFWKWVSTWKDVGSLVEQAEDWDIKTKQKEIKIIKKLMKVI